MASLKEIKNRIASVKNTLKITSAMKLVASAKLHKAQQNIDGMLPYGQKLEQIVNNLVSSGIKVNSSFIQNRQKKRVAIVAISSSASLCGGFNNNIIRLTEETIADYKHSGVDSIILYPIGRKIENAFASRTDIEIDNNFMLVADKPNYNEIKKLAELLMKKYTDGDFDHVELLYTHYKNMAVQVLMRDTYLPIEVLYTEDKESVQEMLFADYIVEPSPEELLNDLLPQVLCVKLCATIFDSNAAEHAARTFAMQQASDNADSLLQELSLMYNKVRQQAITNELLDIIGGSLK